jgi:hypothetical protein
MERITLRDIETQIPRHARQGRRCDDWRFIVQRLDVATSEVRDQHDHEERQQYE